MDIIISILIIFKSNSFTRFFPINRQPGQPITDVDERLRGAKNAKQTLLPLFLQAAAKYYGSH